MKTKAFNFFYALMCLAILGLVTSCSKNDGNDSKKTEEKEDESNKEEEKPLETFEFDKAYAFGELPYLKHGDTKGADGFEKKLAQRQKQTFTKLGEVYWGRYS